MDRGGTAQYARESQANRLACYQRLKSNSISSGVVSDYPAGPKLQALGVEDMFDVVVSAQDVDVGEFKPSPRGLLVAINRLGVSAGEAVYVGDRIDVDAKAARQAGIASFTIGRARSDCETHNRYVTNLRGLTDMILGESVDARDTPQGH